MNLFDKTARISTRPPGRPVAVGGQVRAHRCRLRGHRAQLGSNRSGATSVWACADSFARSGGAWLEAVVVKIVARYSEPGDRVLLAAPPSGASGDGVAGTPAGRRPWRRYDELASAAWTVARLGRSVQTVTADATQGQSMADVPALRSPAGDDASTSTRGAFQMVVTALDPDARDRFDLARWTGLLTQRGTIAVITHCHRQHGRWVDPSPALLADGCRTGLTLLDHIAVLYVPLRTVANARPEPDRGTTVRRTVATVHSDLYMFRAAAALARSDR